MRWRRTASGTTGLTDVHATDRHASCLAPPAAATPPAPRAAAVEKAPAADKPAPAAALTNKDIIDLAAAGLDDDNLIASVNDARAVNFDLTPAGLKTLLAAKVSNRVINAMRARAKKG